MEAQGQLMLYHKSILLNGWKPAVFNIHRFVKSHTDIMGTRYFWNILDTSKHQYCYDQLGPVFKEAGFNLLRIAFLTLYGEEGEIHQDNDVVPGYEPRIARVNLPVLNCNGTETSFYSSKNWNPITKVLPNGIKYTYHNNQDCNFETSVTITEPTIIRVRELHRVTNHTKVYPRITLTCALDPDPVYLLEEN